MKPYDLSQYMYRVSLPSGANLMGYNSSENYAAGTVGEAIKNIGGASGGAGSGSGVATTSYVYNDDIALPPLVGELRFDATPPNNATTMKLHQTTTDDIDAGLAYSYLSPGQRVYLQDADDATRYLKLSVVGPPADMGDWWSFPVLVTEASVPSLNEERVTIGWPSAGASGVGIAQNVVPKGAGAGGLVPSQLFDGGVNVGLGTNAPQAKFHVVGDIRADSVISIGGAPNSDRVLTVRKDVANGGAKVSFMNDNAAGAGFVQVSLTNAAGGGGLTSYAFGPSFVTAGFQQANGALIQADGANGLNVFASSGPIKFATVSAVRMTIAADGNVQIGTGAVGNSTVGSRINIAGANGNSTVPVLGTINADSVLTLSNNANIYGLNVVCAGSGDVHLQSQYFNGTATPLGLTLNRQGGQVTVGGPTSFSSAVTMNGALNVAGVLTTAAGLNVATGMNIQTAHGGGGLVWQYNNASTAARSWGFVSDSTAYGDFSLMTSLDQTGNVSKYRLYFDAGNAAFGAGHIRSGLPGSVGQMGITASGAANTGYIEFFRPDGTRGGYIGNIISPAGDIQYANESSGLHSFNAPISNSGYINCNGYLNLAGSRIITANPATGVVAIRGDAGGWGLEYGFTGSAGTAKGGFGAMGGGDGLTYWYIGAATKTLFWPNGTIETGGSLSVRNGDLTVYRSGGTTGVLYMNAAQDKYLFNNGAEFVFAGQPLNLVGGGLTAHGDVTVAGPGSNIKRDVANGSLNITGGDSLGAGGTIIYRGNAQAEGAMNGGLEFWTQGISRAVFTGAGQFIYGRRDAFDGVSQLPVEIQWGIAINAANTGPQTVMTFMNSQGPSNRCGWIGTSGDVTSYVTSSDERLKTNILDADDPGAVLDAIKVRQFDWIVDGAHQRWGTVAQELYEVAPEAVALPNENDDPDAAWGVDYSKLVPMLIKEIQSLRARMAYLEGYGAPARTDKAP